MHFFILFLGCAFFPTAFTLRCYDCTPRVPGSPNCTDEETDCPDDTQCGAMRIVTFMGEGNVSDVTTKSCAAPGKYISGSLNFGGMRTIIRHKYCASDLCNTNAPEVKTPSPNGMKCKTCTTQDCVSTLDCIGDEDRCVSSTVEMGEMTMSMKGCASKIICSSEANGAITGIDLKCCQGNLCNDAQSIGSSFLLIPLACALSVTLFN